MIFLYRGQVQHVYDLTRCVSLLAMQQCCRMTLRHAQAHDSVEALCRISFNMVSYRLAATALHG